MKTTNRTLLCLCLLWMVVTTTSSQAATRLYDDPRVLRWSQMFLAGRREETLKAVEADLRSASPHPFSPHVWTVTEYSLGRLPQVWANLKDARLRKALGPLPDIYLLYMAGQYRQILAKYPPSQAASIHDPWSLTFLEFAADEEQRHLTEWDYALASWRLQPDHFQTAWNISADMLPDERVHSRVQAMLHTDVKLVGTPIGRYLAYELRFLPMDRKEDENTLAGVETWLQQFPHDSRALFRKGACLASLDRLEEALRAYDAAVRAYPFRTTEFPAWQERFIILMRLKRDDEARKVVAQSAALDSLDEKAAEPLTAHRMAQALLGVDRSIDAEKLLTASLQRWPNNAALQADAAQPTQVQFTYDRDFLRCARRAAELEPDNLHYQVLLMEVLQRKGKEEEGMTLFEQVEKCFAQHSPDFFDEGSALLATLERPDERVRLYERAVAEYPESARMLQDLANALDKAKRPAEALSRLRASFVFEAPFKWSIDKLHTLLGQNILPGKAAQATLQDLMRRFPWCEGLWEHSFYRLPRSLIKTTIRQTHTNNPAPTEAVASPISARPRLVLTQTCNTFQKAAATNASGKILATVDAGYIIKVWKTDTGELLGNIDAWPLADANKSAAGSEKTEADKDKDTFLIVSMTALAVSPDGRTIAANRGYLWTKSNPHETIRMWDSETGKMTREIVPPYEPDKSWSSVTALAFSPDGATLAVSDGAIVRFLDARTGAVRRNWNNAGKGIDCLSYSPDGTVVAVSTSDSLSLWDCRAARRQWRKNAYGCSCVSFSPDGAVMATANGGSFSYRDYHDGQIWGSLTEVPEDEIDAYLPTKMLALAQEKTPIKPDGTTDTTRLFGTKKTAEDATPMLSHDGRTLAFITMDKKVLLRDMVTGVTRVLRDKVGLIPPLAFSLDDRKLAVAGEDNTITLWDVATAELRHTLIGHKSKPTTVLFQPQSTQLYSFDGSADSPGVFVWDTEHGDLLRQNKDSSLEGQVFSSDGKYVTWGAFIAPRVQIYPSDATTGKPLHPLRADPANKTMLRSLGHEERHRLQNALLQEEHIKGASALSGPGPAAITVGGPSIVIPVILRAKVAFNPVTSIVASVASTTVPIIWIWDYEADKFIGTLKVHDEVLTLAFSPDGKLLASAGQDYSVTLWDWRAQRRLCTLQGHEGSVTDVAFTRDGKFLISHSTDGTTRFWTVDGADSRLLLTLVQKADGAWAVFDPDGRYDSSQGGDVEGVHWVIGNETVSLSQLKDRYYEPNLLAKLLGYNKEPLKDVRAFTAPAPYPDVIPTIQSMSNGGSRLTLDVTNRGGGIGRVQVFVNGKELLADARGPKPDPKAAHATLPVSLLGAPLEPGKPNTIRVVAYNGEDYFSSRGVELVYRPRGVAQTLVHPDLYAIVVGVSKFDGSYLNLRFAAKDAEDFAKALTLGSNRLFGAPKTHLTLLTTTGNPGTALPTKENIRKAFLAARKARPADILVVYLAGHGVAVQRGHDLYCYLTHDARSGDPAVLADPALRARYTVSSEELTEWIKKIPALKQVMVLDTCAAAAAAAQLVDRRDIPSDQVRALERLKDRTGFHVLMGCAADAVSYETSRYGQGLLTYALLQGMRGAALRDGEILDVEPLFQYARDQVPELARGIGGIQEPRIAAPRGDDFPIGQLKREDQELVPLAKGRPLILRPMLLDPDDLGDRLGLTDRLGERLREESYAVGRGDEVVFVDAPDMPGAIQPKGTYTVQGKVVHVRLALWSDGVPIQTLQVDGAADDPDGLATKLVEAIRTAVGKP